MKQVFTVSLLVLFFPFIGLSQCPPNSENVTLLYHFDDDGVATLYGDSFNDCWGYTDASGNEYAILGGIDSIYVFDITIPSSAYKVDADHIPQNSLWRDFKTYDHYLYAVSDQPGTSTGLLVYDLDSLASGKLHLINGYNSIFNRAHNIFIEEATSKLYVVGSNTGAANEGVLIYDLSTDAYAQNPNLIKAVNFDTLVNNPSLSTYIHDIFVRNDTAYCAHGYTGYYIWDLSNPTNLDASAFVGSMDNSTSTMGGYVHSSWNTPDNKYAIMAVEVNGSFPDKKQLFVIDQNNINAPVLETTWKEPLLECVGELNNVPHNPMLRGDTMFVSYYHDGIQILDFSDPTNPQRIGFYDTDTTNTSYPGYTGAWGIYPFFPSGNFIGSDMHNGLFVFKYEDVCPTPPDIDPIADVTACDLFTFPLIEGSNLSGNQAYYDGPGGTGTSYGEGTTVFSGGTYYAYDGVDVCFDEEVFELTINSSPIATAANNISICNGDTTTISATASGGQAPYTYLWNQGLGLGQSHDVFPVVNTNYTVTVTDVNGCSDTDVQTVIVHQNPTIDAGEDESVCFGNTITISANASGGSSPYTYFWDNGLGSGQSHDVSPQVNTTYSVTVTDSNGCENFDSVIISVEENPSVNAGADQVLCSGISTSIYAEGSGGLAPYTYSWDNGLGDGQMQLVSPDISTTYTVTITDANGCTSQDQIEINVFPSPIADAGVDTTICMGESLTLTAMATDGLEPYVYEWDNGLGEGQSHAVSPIVTTTYEVTVTDALSCSSTDQILITVNDLPEVDIQGLNLLCEGQSQVLDAGPGFAAYLWNTGESTQSITVSTAGIYAVTVDDINGCSAMDDLELIVVDSLHPEISGALSFCAGENTSLDAGNGFGSYEWNTGAITQSIQVETPGIYSVTVTNAIGCEGSQEVTVVEHSAPTVLADLDMEICYGESAFINSNGTGGSPPYTYFWDNGLGEGQSHTVSPTVTTTYTVLLTDANGCTSSDQLIVTVSQEINSAISPDQQICIGSSAEISANASGGTAPFTYFWDNGLGEGQSHTVSPTVSTSYHLTITDALGCEQTDSLFIEVLPELVPEIMGNTVICENSTTVLDAGSGYNNYLWSTGDTSQTIEVDAAGTYSVTVSNSLSCEGSAEVVVIINPVPIIDISPDGEICFGMSTEIHAEVSDPEGMYVYTWDNGLGEGSTHEVSPETSTTYSVSITDDNDCVYVASVNIVVHENPVVTASDDTQICFGESTTISGNASGGLEPYSFNWDNGLGEGDSHTVSPDSATLYTVSVLDQHGCQAVDSTEIFVFPAIDLAVSGELFLCNGASTELNAGSGFESYLWSTGDTSQTVVITEGGVYTITVRDTNNCEAIQSVEITLVDSLEVNISGDLTICEGDSTILDAGAGFNSYNWSTGDTSQTIVVFETGEFSVSVSSIAGCEGNSIVNTQLVPKPEIVTSDDQTICRGEETIINAVVVGGSIPASFFWDQGLGEGDTQVVSPDTTTTYNVLVTDGLNCSENAETTVFVEPTPDNGIVLNAPAELMAEQDNAVYQWLDCDNNFAVIEGETEQIFNPTTSGNYAVEISLNDCIDTSDCLQVIISDVKDISSKGYRIYPVPTKDFVQISANVDIKGLPYRIYSLEGQLLVSAVLSDDGRISLEHYVPGMYLLEIDGALFKLVKM